MNQPEQQSLISRTYPSVEATDDVEGHVVAGPPVDEVEEEEDVEGHMQPPRDLDIDRF